MGDTLESIVRAVHNSAETQTYFTKPKPVYNCLLLFDPVNPSFGTSLLEEWLFIFVEYSMKRVGVFDSDTSS